MEPWSRCSERAWYRRPSMARVLLWSVWLALASAACSSPVTQLVVVVRSDLPPSDLAEVSVGVIPGEPFTSAPATQHFDIATCKHLPHFGPFFGLTSLLHSCPPVSIPQTWLQCWLLMAKDYRYAN